MSKNEKLILVGVVSGAHGIKGHVTVRSFTEQAENLVKLSLQNIEGEKITLKFSHHAKRDLVCMMSGIKDRTAAEKARGIKLYTLRSNLPEAKEEEFYFADLIGLKVVNMHQEIIGKISGVHNFGAGDMIEISAPDKKSELYPFTKELFPEITNEYILMTEYKAIGDKEK
jgi:16S rRNA processing protein RimM